MDGVKDMFGMKKGVRATFEIPKDCKIKFVVKKAKPVFTDSYSVEVTPLEPGAYDVDWTAVAKDGHVMKGKLSFKIAP